MNCTRRDFIRLGLGGAATLAWPVSQGLRAQTHGGHDSTTPALPAFVDALPIPTVLKPTRVGSRDTYTLTMKNGVAKCHRDLPFTNILGYEGLFPGSTIRATKNRTVRITQINNLPATHHGHSLGEHPPAVHLHGGLVAPDSDGHPNDGIPAGESRVYEYPNRQRACGLWYHDHSHGATGLNVYLGLAGLYFIDDPREKALNLPRDSAEVPLIIQDRTFDSGGQLVYDLDATTLEAGKYGDVVLVNGKIQPYFEVGSRKYRFRVLNASNAREYKLALSNGSPLVQIGTDGGLLQRPQPRSSITIAPSERADFIVDFSHSALGSSVILQNQGGELRTGSIMQFRTVRTERDKSSIPDFLNPWEELSGPLVTREFILNRQIIDSAPTWVINGFAFQSPGRVIPTPKLDSVEHWRFVNPTNHPHPMHLHLVQFQVINLDGEPQDASDFGWKDTVVVPPGGEVTVAARFSGYLGKYVFHCHNLEHEDFAMMGEFQVIT